MYIVLFTYLGGGEVFSHEKAKQSDMELSCTKGPMHVGGIDFNITCFPPSLIIWSLAGSKGGEVMGNIGSTRCRGGGGIILVIQA